MSKYFPPADTADENGIVAIGGELSVPWLIDAYSHGIFPWPIWEHEGFPITWFSFDPRAIFELGKLHISKRLRRTLRSGKFQVTCDQAFSEVIRECSKPRHNDDGVWITAGMISAYEDMFHAGYAHSVEVWEEHQLVGGIYGISLGGLFAGESMFHHERDASKVALATLEVHLRSRGYQLFDIQQLTPHTESMGATEISRTNYLKRLSAACLVQVTFGKELEIPDW